METNNLTASLNAFLSTLGVEGTETRDQVTETVEAELGRRGHEAEIVELRYGVLTLASSPMGAKFLRYDQDNILATLKKELPDVVAEIRIRVRRN